MADLDATFMQEILDLAQREREPDVKHHRQADDLRARLEVPEGAGLGHGQKLSRRPARLKPVSSDRAPPGGGSQPEWGRPLLAPARESRPIRS